MKSKKIVLILILLVCLTACLALAACNFDNAKVVFDYNGATGNNNVVSKRISFGEPLGELPAPTRDGYEFVGWYRGDILVTAETVWEFSFGDIRVVARWKEIEVPPQPVQIEISASAASVEIGGILQIYVSTQPSGHEGEVVVAVKDGAAFGHMDGTVFCADAIGEAVLQGTLALDGETYVSNELTISVTEEKISGLTITLTADKYLIEYSDNCTLYATVNPSSYEGELTFVITDGEEVATLVGNGQTYRSVYPLDEGYVTVTAKIGGNVSNSVTVQIIRYDPYTNVGASGFYDHYTPAADLEDSYWRTKHNLMSGSIEEQDKAPTISPSRPKSDNKFVRNTDENYADNGNSYKVVDFNGNVVNTVYKCGAYVTLEEVAAYVYAWGDIPKNYTSAKSGSPASNPWGKYLRLNNSQFSGSVDKYPYEPVLPDISGCGGSLQYYEIDVGTTGSGYSPTDYNDGSKITRGAARIVYARYQGSRLLNPSERYVFYTYNHYNDFQEYLNYQNGWGEMFGNATGGGTLDSKSDYNPTPYVVTARSSFGMR